MEHCIKLKLKIKVLLGVLFLVVMEVSITWLLNSYYLEKYYIYSEKNFLKETYYEIQKEIKESNNKTDSILYSLSYKRQTSVFMADIILQRDQYIITNYFTVINPSSIEFDSFYNIVSQAISKIDVNEIDYNITVRYDKLLSANFLLLQGMIDSNTFIVMRLPIENIERSASISNRFLLFSGLLVIGIGSIIMYFISQRLTIPIKEMALVAQNLTKQKFNIKVKMITNDELGDLGRSINLLSTKLEETISDLKSANLELQNDINYKIEIDEIRRNFLTQISHELKTPIALIQGYAEGLSEDLINDDENRKFYSEVIIDEAKNMNKLVSKLLVLNQLELGNKEMHIVNFNIVEVLSNRIKAFESQISLKNINIKFDSNNSIFVWADEFMIEEVINNYLNNAIDHTDSGGIISIYYKCEGNNIRIFIRNIGSQIPIEDIDKIWTKLYKVDKARTREYGGIGLGLSIVSAIMNAHGKGYGVSNMEDGVEFYFDLNLN
jgi:two-component system sensor histidine kinase VanS